MHRNDLIQLLERYNDELESKEKILDFVRNNSDCFERSNTYGHITSSSWLLNEDYSKVLLTHHRKLNKWLQPGGHCDGESDVPASALSEAIEESGIQDWKFIANEIFDLDVHLIPARKSEPEHFHFDVRFAFSSSDEKYVVSEESHDLAWVDLKEIEQYTDEESILRMVRKTAKLSAIS